MPHAVSAIEAAPMLVESEQDSGETSQLAVQVPDIYSEQVHASRKGQALDKAVEALVTPFIDVSGSGRAPKLQAIHLSANVNVLPSGALAGFVAVAEGDAPVAPLLTGDRIGTGVTWFRLKDVSEQDVVKDFSSRVAPGFSLAEAAPEGRVTVVRGTEYPNTVFYLVVEGNDQSKAQALREAVAAKAVAPTVKQVIKTDSELKALYSGVFRASRELRNSIASKFAEAHDLAIDTGVPAGDQDTHIIQYSAVHSERSGSANRANRDVFLVYDNVIDSSEAHAGVLLFKGPISGYMMIAGRQHTVQGRPSFAWDNSTKNRRFSMFPADTGLYLGRASGRIPDRHLGTSPAIKAAGQERIKWSGDVKTYNPNAEQVYHSPTDAAFLQVQSGLGAPPGGECSFVTLDTVVTELPGITTKDQALPDLIEILNRSDEQTIPVKTTGAVFLSLIKNWPAIRQHTKAKRLADIFADEHEDHVMVTEDVLRAVARVQSEQEK